VNKNELRRDLISDWKTATTACYTHCHINRGQKSLPRIILYLRYSRRTKLKKNLSWHPLCRRHRRRRFIFSPEISLIKFHQGSAGTFILLRTCIYYQYILSDGARVTRSEIVQGRRRIDAWNRLDKVCMYRLQVPIL